MTGLGNPWVQAGLAALVLLLVLVRARRRRHRQITQARLNRWFKRRRYW
jgi:MYXO-CTERM domain-containing protein